jgi:hypothetical protein
LVASPLMFTWTQTLRPAEPAGRAFDNAAAARAAVDRVHPVEAFGDLARLVGLQAAR